MNNITSTSELDLENIAHVAATEEQRRQYGVAAGDVLFNNRNSADLVGKVAVADSRVDGWLFNNNIIRLRLEPQIEPRFFALQLTSPGYRDRLVQLRSASTNVAAIYSRDLKACNFWLPSMRVQLKIIEDHDRIISSLTIGRALLSKLSARASKLRKALLAEAFAGSLVQQDPVDEPASVLLDRIYAERVAQPKTGRTRKNNTP